MTTTLPILLALAMCPQVAAPMALESPLVRGQEDIAGTPPEARDVQPQDSKAPRPGSPIGQETGDRGAEEEPVEGIKVPKAGLPPAESPLGAEYQDEQARAQLIAAMAQAGIHLDLEAQIVSIPATVQVRQDLLEYVLCTPRGQGHESLFLTEVSPTILNAALLALGLQRGSNVSLLQEGLALDETQVDGRGGPASGELPADVAASAPQITLPKGDGLYLYVAWREAEELYFYRVDDLIANLATGRTLRRHAWIFLGSRMVQPRTKPGEEPSPEIFAAEFEGNLINVSFFFAGNTLLTPAVDECVQQTVWIGNQWLLPPSSSPVEFFFSRRPLESVPEAWRESLPVIKPATAGALGARGFR